MMAPISIVVTLLRGKVSTVHMFIRKQLKNFCVIMVSFNVDMTIILATEKIWQREPRLMSFRG